jgi:PAS domain S-box-containing protein
MDELTQDSDCDLRLLLVEDSEADAKLAIWSLKEAGFRCSYESVSSESEMRSALSAGLPDIILSDFRMPRFDGLSALAIARDVAPGVPLIFLSGMIGEERAIEALNNGATDYILKSNPMRLAPAVKRALKHARLVRQSAIVEREVTRLTEVLQGHTGVNAAQVPVANRDDMVDAFLAPTRLDHSGPETTKGREDPDSQAVSSLQSAILNAVNYAIISTSVDGIVTSFNSTAERWLGYAAAEVIGKAAPDAWHDPDEMIDRAGKMSVELGRTVRPGFETFVAKACLRPREEREWTLIRKDNSRFSGSLSITTLLDNTGKTVGYVRVIADITKRKERDAELRLSEERFRRAFDDAPIGMALVGLAGRWLRVNRSLCEMIGYTEAELLETDLQAVTHHEDLETELGLLRQVLAGEVPSYQMEKRYLHKNGSLVFAMLSVSLVRDANSNPVYFVKQIENITQRREIDRIKLEFIGTVSHELRTPLTAIRGSLGLVQAGALGKLPEKAEAMVKIAHQNCEHLVHIINDILDAEKIESGRMEMHIADVPVRTFLEQALAVNEGYGAKYSVRFVLEGVSDRVGVRADPDRLMQVMANLLSNAAKFSARGGEVVVRASEKNMSTRIEVEDRGTGIPEAFQKRIFEKFAQAESSTSRRFEGTGLGLSITRNLVEAMGGTIGFSTVTGQGTIFYFELPRADQAAPPIQAAVLDAAIIDQTAPLTNTPPRAPKRDGLPRILHVEDNKDLSNVIKTVLAGKAEVVSASTLQAAEQLLCDEAFSLVLLDMGLPDGHGLSLLEAPALAAQSIPVVILSTTEMSRRVQQRVAATLVKSRVSEAHIVQKILSLLPAPLSEDCCDPLA